MLEQFVDELITIGARLGVLEDEKGRLQPTPGQQGTGLGAALLAARNQWVRVGEEGLVPIRPTEGTLSSRRARPMRRCCVRSAPWIARIARAGPCRG